MMPLKDSSNWRLVIMLTIASLAWIHEPVSAQSQPEVNDKAPSGLTLEQERLASRFERLEAVAARLAELAEQSEPEHAEQLRRTIKSSREKGIADRFTTIVGLLESERLSAAARDQVELKAELELLLQVLLEDPNDSERDKLKKFLKAQIRELGNLIREQRSLRNQNQEGADADRLAGRQSKTGESAGEVQRALEANSDQSGESGEGESSEGESGEGEPSEGKSGEGKSGEGKSGEGKSGEGKSGEGESGEGQSGEGQSGEGQSGEGQSGEGQSGEGQSGEGQSGPSGESQDSNDPLKRAAERVAEAQRAMDKAVEKLRDANRRGAADDQREAQRELEAARAELERILRQLREEEMERLLAKLIARFSEMLKKQQGIYDDTISIHKATAESASRNLMLQAIRLSRREAELVRDAEKALTLLREDGTSIAFPETTQQIAEDMRSVTARLATAGVGPITQTIELDIIAAIQDMIGALEQARDELAENEGNSPPPGSGGSPGESPLVSKIAELRMIRTLQARVYKRTQDLGNLANNPLVNKEDLAGELENLAKRQERIFEATRDLDTDANR